MFASSVGSHVINSLIERTKEGLHVTNVEVVAQVALILDSDVVGGQWIE